MAVFTKYRRARKPHKCDHNCGVLIKVGETYIETKMAPFSHPEVTNEHWETYKGHVAFCPDGSF